MLRSALIFSLTAVCLISCQQNSLTHYEENPETDIQNIYIPGKAKVKVSEELAARLSSEDSAEELMAGATVRRTFPHGGIYEERMRKHDLHLWYDVEFDEKASLTKAGEELSIIDGVEIVEYVPCPEIFSDERIFNDPDLKKQWHYINEGNPLTGLIAGCDINVGPAWERGIVGKDNVIVAVVDEGIDVDHEDLKANMWEGIGPDGKTINGYNFVRENYTISPQDHGTHVAGTIAAVNNNGIGVCGIAGGNAAEGIGGVRIMACQILDGDLGGDEAAALVWAADNGAVIAQNSWGYKLEGNPMTDTPKYVKSAIDYFNEFAGCDADGNQRPDSPMKGGVVIFSSGNEASKVGYPGSYEGCIAVSATGGEFQLASYSNYGDWIDITAPGGEARANQYILSTVARNGYGNMQGTSMACPHVSGVAALIVSEFGGPGFTREQLIERLLKTATDISLPANQMGAGLVNAYAAVAHYGEDLPAAPEFAGSEQTSGTSLLLKYLIPEDNKGVECRRIDIYCSSDEIKDLSGLTPTASQKIANGNPGDTVRFSVEGLSLNSTYHFSAVSYDAFDYASPEADYQIIKTRDNLAPEIKALNGVEHTLKQYALLKLKFEIRDPENALKEVRYENATGHDTFEMEGNIGTVTINAANIAAGSYNSKIIATDEYDKTCECEISFTIEENIAPEVTGEMSNVLFTALGKSRKIALAEYISDADGESLTYTAESSSTSVVKTFVAKNQLTLDSMGYGEAVITVTGKDAFGKTAQTTFIVLVRNGDNVFDLYPNPVKDGKLHIRSSLTETIKVKISGSSGSVIFDGELPTDPFAPAVADIKDAVPGVYNVQVTSGSGKVFNQNIVKL